MIPVTWRTAIGPLVTLAIAGALLASEKLGFAVILPGPIFMWAIVFAAYYGGTASGLISTAVAVAYSAYFFAEPGTVLAFQPNTFTRFLVTSIVGPAIAVTVGVLHAREERALARERETRRAVEDANSELMRLHAALDQVEDGVVLLDHELRAQFINRAFRRIWDLPDAKADSKVAYIALLYHGRDTGAYLVPPDEVDAYVAERIAQVRSGDENPHDLRLTNGEVYRFRCKALPEGGRMLTYSRITDLVKQADALQELATVDGLTGAYNRQHFLAVAAGEWERFQRYGRPLSLLMLDIDHFKSINDTLGHDAGDKVIAQVASVCRSGRRGSDIVARLGGEEFVVLLPETTLADALLVAERLRSSVSEEPAYHMRKPVPTTISVGVAEAGPGMRTVKDLMGRADRALYDAKHAGRDRVVAAPSVKSGPRAVA